MPWGLFTLALLIVYLVQTTLLRLLGVEPLDLFLALALVCGLTAPAPEARLAGWLTGLAQDIGSDHPIGLQALALGLAVLTLTYLRELVNQHLWWARWLIAFLAALVAQLLVRLDLRFVQHGQLSWAQIAGGSLLTALLASLLAALLVGLPASVGRRDRRRRALPPRW